MSVTAPERPAAPAPTSDENVRQWKRRIEQARGAQRPHVGTWLSNLAFAAGQHWLVWDPYGGGGMRHIQTVDPRYQDRELYTADRINEFWQAQLGELESDDDRPQLLTAQDGSTAEEVAKTLNDAVAHAWEHEWNIDEVLAEARRNVTVLGTVAIRRRWDPSLGRVVGYQPMHPAAGQPVQTPDDLAALEQHGTLADGSLPHMQPVREGRSVLDLYTPFGILAPPGVHHEDRFPWFVLARPVELDTVKAQYPAANGLVEDTDIASAMGLSAGQTVSDDRSQGSATSQRLKGHVWLYTCFERPCPRYPDGRVTILASNQYVLLEQRDQLDYQMPDGQPHDGVTFLHWWRLPDRFYSRSFIEPMKDPQRAINELETVKHEIGRRGLPKVFVEDESLIETPQGAPLEVIRMKKGAATPNFFAGIGPGDWMNIEKAGHVDNLSHAATLSTLRLGENPQNVDTYSQLALINEQEDRKRATIQRAHKRAIADQVVLGVYDIRRYWPAEKLILVAGDDESISRQTFAKAQIPDFYMVKVPKGAPQPRSQGAELKKIDAFWAAAAQSGLVASDPDAWVNWYVESINAGSAQELPEAARGTQQELAGFENLLMQQGDQPAVADYDLVPEHLPVHREAMDQARAAEDNAWYLRLYRHVQDHVAQAQRNAALVGAAQGAPSPLAAAAAQPQTGGQPPNPIFVRGDFQQLAAGQ